jgi:nucleoside-diphosphate-sugar epimerase
VNQLLDHVHAVIGRKCDAVYKDFHSGGVRRAWCEIDKTWDAFGFDPTAPLADGLAQTWAWFEANHAATAGQG